MADTVSASSDAGPPPLDPGPSSLGPGLYGASVFALHARVGAPPPPSPAGASAFAIVEQPPGWLVPGVQVEVEMKEEGLYGSLYCARVIELRAKKALVEFAAFCIEGADDASDNAPLLQVPASPVFLFLRNTKNYSHTTERHTPDQEGPTTTPSASPTTPPPHRQPHRHPRRHPPTPQDWVSASALRPVPPPPPVGFPSALPEGKLLNFLHDDGWCASTATTRLLDY